MMLNRPKKPPTKKQEEARTRNWRIRQLRAFYHLCPPALPKEVAAEIRELVDEVIMGMGAESEKLRLERRYAEIENESTEEQVGDGVEEGGSEGADEEAT